MVKQIRVEELAAKLKNHEPIVLLDVRQPWEHESCKLAESILIPLGELPGRLDEVEATESALVVVYCHHGVRSLSGAAILQQAGFNAVSLAGGIDAWSLKIDPTLPRY